MSSTEHSDFREILQGYLQHALVLVIGAVVLLGLNTFVRGILDGSAPRLLSYVARILDTTSALSLVLILGEFVIWLGAIFRSPSRSDEIKEFASGRGQLEVEWIHERKMPLDLGRAWSRDALTYGVALLCVFLVYRLHIVASGIGSAAGRTLVYAGAFVFLWEAVLLLSRHVSGTLRLVRQ